MRAADQKTEALSKLVQVVVESPVAFFVTSSSDHALRSRPMVNVNNKKFDGELWFFTHKRDPKVKEASENPNVNVSFVSTDMNRFASLSGKAKLVQDRKHIELLWTEACAQWFPKGREDPNLALLRVDVDYAEYWDEQTGIMQAISGLIKRAFKGEAEKDSYVQHEKFDWV